MERTLWLLGGAGLLLGSLLGTTGTPLAAAPQHLGGHGDSSDEHLCLLQDVGAKAVRRRGLQAEVQDGQGPEEVGEFSCVGGSAFSDFPAEIASEQYFWANKNGDALCSGASNHEAPSNISGGPAWSFKDETASIMSSHPCIDDSKDVYLSHRNGKLRKFGADGTLKWTNTDNFDMVAENPQTSQVVTGGPVLLNGSIYTGSTDGYVLCVDMSSGKTRWRQKVAAAMFVDSWSLSGRSGIVLVAAVSVVRPIDVPGGADEIVALDANNGEVLWRWLVPDNKRVYNWLGSFTEAPPSVVFATSEGRPYRVRLCDGKTLWAGPDFAGELGEAPGFSTGGLAMGPNGLAYVTSNVGNGSFAYIKSSFGADARGRLSAYNVSTGQLVWRQEQTMPANNAPSVGSLDGSGSRLSVVVALGANAMFPDPVAEASGHYIDGTPVAWYTELRAFDAATGEPTAWRFEPPPHRKPQAEGDSFPDHICLPDAWSNGAIDARGTYFVGHMSGNIFALRDIDGDGTLNMDEASGEVTSYYGGRCYQGSPAIAPGMLVAAPCDGMHVFLGE